MNVQGSDKWYQERVGECTNSKLIAIMPGKSGYRVARDDYIGECLCGRLTGEVQESINTKDILWGKEYEPLARSAYEAVTGNLVEEVGYLHSDIKYYGGSPDGLVGSEGMIEIKCPKTKTHLKTMATGEVKQDYLYQMQGNLMTAKRKWCDFVSYDPRLPDKHSLYIKRFEYNEEMAEKILTEVKSFLAEVDEMMERLG